MVEWIGRLFCCVGRCLACRVYETPDGIGGKCVRCGKVHGWVTSAELRAYADRDAAALRGALVAHDAGYRARVVAPQMSKD